MMSNKMKSTQPDAPGYIESNANDLKRAYRDIVTAKMQFYKAHDEVSRVLTWLNSINHLEYVRQDAEAILRTIKWCIDDLNNVQQFMDVYMAPKYEEYSDSTKSQSTDNDNFVEDIYQE